MDKNIFKNRHYNMPGHAHELTFSVYRRLPLFENCDACKMLLAEIESARIENNFCLWAYVIMPNHVHVLIWPQENTYSIESVTKTIKGRMAKRFIKFCKESDNEGIGRIEPYKIVERGAEQYRIWQ